MSPKQKKIFYRDRSVGFTASVLMHAALLIGSGVVFAQGAQFAVESGTGGVEVNLIAALPESAMTEFIQSPEPPKEIPPSPALEEMPLPQEAIEEKPPVPEPPSPVKGDGSSPVPGKDAATLQSAGGAIMEAKPNYLRNPAPAYPFEARENGWEGLVVMRVSVDRTGRAIAIELESGSGYDVLDKSALRTVRTWKFKPARIGSLPVDSVARVPVRFKLSDYKL